MSPYKPYKYRDLIKKMKKYDNRFDVYVDRGKGSHRMIYHPDVNGKSASFPIICHSEGSEINKSYIAAIIRRFNLPDGVL